MKIRTQLVIASFLLSILPLSAIVGYSYHSSRKAVETAYRREAAMLTRQMEQRLASIRTDLEQRLAEVSALPLRDLGETARAAAVRNVVAQMGDTASVVDALEIQPLPPDAGTHPNAPPPPAPPVVVDIPSMLAMTPLGNPQASGQLDEITRLSMELSQNAESMTPAQRDALKARLAKAQAAVDASMQAAGDRYAKRTSVIIKMRERQQRRADDAKRAALLFGHPLNSGPVSAHVSADEVIKRVLGGAAARDEIAFAVDRDNNVYTRTDAERRTLESIGLLARVRAKRRIDDIPNWVTAVTFDPQSGLRIGVARPVGDTFEELRRTAAKNFGYGMALVFIALIGIVPLANHITRDVKQVTAGAERIAHGDLETRLPVSSRNEFGQLANAFNRMAEDLSVQQRTIVEQERARKDYERKTMEMEEARRFQLSMLPKRVPATDGYDVAVYTQTATEVGGDYYDFHVAPSGALSVTIGDATGHGAKAGTMVTVIKTLFSGYDGGLAPSDFLRDAAETVKRMELGRMAMALVLARLDGERMTIASAGMPPAYVHRAATGTVEEVAIGATPLGTLGVDYADVALPLAAGDTVLFMTDGFPELLNDAGQQLGYVTAQQEFAAAATAPDANGVIAALSDAARRWHGDQPPNDDVTFVVVRARTS